MSSELLCGQRVSFGFVGSSNLTRDFPISHSVYFDPQHPEGLTAFDLFSDTHSFLAGLSVEVDIAGGLSLEADALHRTLHLQQRTTLPDGSVQGVGQLSVTTWEHPILLKYRWPALRGVQPFVEAGPSFRTRHNPAPTEPSQVGGTAGAGMEFRMGRFHVSPAVRHTRWQYDGDFPRFATKRDQLEFVAGFSYATSLPSWHVGGKKLRFGLIVGTPFTGALPQVRAPQHIDELQGYIAGLAAEVEWSRRLSMEVDGLYRPFRAHYRYDDPIRAETFTDEFTVLTWEIPLLAKYRLSTTSRIQPLLEAGPSFRIAGNTNSSHPSPFGLTAGAGFASHYREVQIAPVVRFTAWLPDSHAPRTKWNQVELLVSFTL